MRSVSAAWSFARPGCSAGLRPAMSEKTVAPNDHTSVATVPPVSPRSTSGAAHGTETPAASVASCCRPAMPKSLSTGWPNEVVRMFAGLMSRCSTPPRWAVSTAAPMRIATRSAASGASGSARKRSPSSGFASSITR